MRLTCFSAFRFISNQTCKAKLSGISTSLKLISCPAEAVGRKRATAIGGAVLKGGLGYKMGLSITAFFELPLLISKEKLDRIFISNFQIDSVALFTIAC